MAFFQYQARDVQGIAHKGVLEAASELEAARKLKSGKLYPVRIKPVRRRRIRSVPDEHVIRLFYDLSDLLTAGLPVDRALALISKNQSHKVFSQIVQDLFQDVQGGADLSEALGKHRDVFGDLPSHMVRAGEASGTLATILKRLATYAEQRMTFKQNMISAMVYPVILLGMSSISIVVLLVYVIPKFALIFQDLHQDIPVFTKMLLDAGVLIRDYGWLAPVLLGLIFFGWRYLYRLPRVREKLDIVLIRLPLSRYLVLNSELTRFCRTLGTMLQSGVPLLRALSLGDQILINTGLRKALSPLHREIKMGHSMSNFFRNHTLFPARIGTMLRIAEEQGNLGEGLLNLGDHFEKELQKRLQRLMSLMEPAVIIITGVVIGAMVLSMFTAILSINEVQF